MKSPAERYIKYLCVGPESLDNDSIFNLLQLQDLDPISPGYIDRVRDSVLSVPRVYHPTDPRHKPSVAYNRLHGIYYLMMPRKEDRAARNILLNGRAKEATESLILAGMSDERITTHLRRLRRFRDLCDGAVASYRYHYFDTADLGSTELRALMRVRTGALGSSPEDRSPARAVLAEAMRKESYRDSRKVAANLPNSPAAALLALVQQGFYPGDIKLTDVLMQTKTLLVLRAYDVAWSNNPEMHNQISGILAAVESIDRTLERSEDPTNKLREGLNKLRMRTERGTVPTIEALTQGRVSAPMLQPKEEKVVHAVSVESARTAEKLRT